MAKLNLNYAGLMKSGDQRLTAEQDISKLKSYLYQLTEQLQYWQYHIEEENLDVTFKSGYESLMSSVTAMQETVTQLEETVQTMSGMISEVKIKVASSQPSGSGFLWAKPTGSTLESTTYETAIQTEEEWTGTSGTHILTLDRSSGEQLSETPIKYGVYLRLWNYGAARTLTGITIFLRDENSTITLMQRTEQSITLAASTVYELNTLSDGTSSQINLTGRSSLTLTIMLTFAEAGGTQIEGNSTVQVKATCGQSSGGPDQCELYYVE